MPRNSPYRIQLSDADQQELERRARSYTLPYRDVMRAKMVLLAATGMRNTRSPPSWTPAARSSPSGASASSSKV
jgi:hypothetical protein